MIFEISQFGKITIRHTLSQAMKVMHDRRITKRDRGLLRVYCDSFLEAEKIINNKQFFNHCTFVFVSHKGIEYFWDSHQSKWTKSNEYFSDESL